ncbi:uncharacterized protein LOC129760375 [Uranotaenia lowii]|uniref:uncharacterized protein LOC129760375 n=1 Tax=Uranotaenia lowii TaxID=190385 RepID=UPI0024786E03|nr:uncharacterized protein LOC129760375 [Uranotaenia lowii]
MCLDGANEEGPSKLPVAATQSLLEKIVHEQLESDDVAITLSAGSNKGDNYIGIVFRARAECRKSGKVLHIIAKLPPITEARRNQFFARPSFEREISFYTEIYPMLEQFQQERGIDPKDGREAFNQIPQCLATCLDEFEEAIFMRDLKEEGFSMVDRHSIPTIQHFRMVVKGLARLHALSFGLKDQHPERIEPYKSMVELFTTRDWDDSMEQWFKMLIDRAMGTLDKDKEPEVFEKVQKALDGKFIDLVVDMTKGEHAEPYAVICHGDCWNNNIMFKHENNTPTKLCLLDWQICRYASPVLDLMYFLFTASDKAIRDKHYQELIDLYHETLSEFLIRLGSDPEKLFPRSALDAQLQRFGRFGLLMAVMLLPITTTKSEDVPDLEEMAQKLENGFDVADEVDSFRSEDTEAVYRQKMGDCCRDIVRLGYI